MKNVLRAAALATALAVTGTGCTHSIHLVHVSDYGPYARYTDGKVIKASSEQFVIMGFRGDTKYVEQAMERLVDQCPKGRIQGITTQFSTSHGFFSWHNKILMQGLCLN